jgi:hypothetical protein
MLAEQDVLAAITKQKALQPSAFFPHNYYITP